MVGLTVTLAAKFVSAIRGAVPEAGPYHPSPAELPVFFTGRVSSP